jgi:hypothetical protein
MCSCFTTSYNRHEFDHCWMKNTVPGRNGLCSNNHKTSMVQRNETWFVRFWHKKNFSSHRKAIICYTVLETIFLVTQNLPHRKTIVTIASSRLINHIVWHSSIHAQPIFLYNSKHWLQGVIQYTHKTAF